MKNIRTGFKGHFMIVYWAVMAVYSTVAWMIEKHTAFEEGERKH